MTGDAVVEVEERASRATISEGEASSIDTSEFDPSDEEWEGSMSWKGSKKTVAEEISKIDLASLTDWDE